MLQYKEVDEQVASAALAVLNRDLWYLRPQTVVLSLSSEKVTDEEKAEMAAKMRGLESPEEYEEENVVITRTTRLPDLVSEQLWLVFPN